MVTIETLIFIIGLTTFSLVLLLALVMISIYVAHNRGEDLESEEVIDKYADVASSITLIVIVAIVILYIA